MAEKKPEPPKQPIIPTEVHNRLRIVEERTTSINKKTEIIENNLLEATRKIQKDIQVSHDNITELKHRLDKIEQQLSMVVKELSLTADKNDLAKIQKYLELWNPVKFATLSEVEKMIQELR